MLRLTCHRPPVSRLARSLFGLSLCLCGTGIGYGQTPATKSAEALESFEAILDATPVVAAETVGPEILVSNDATKDSSAAVQPIILNATAEAVSTPVAVEKLIVQAVAEESKSTEPKDDKDGDDKDGDHKDSDHPHRGPGPMGRSGHDRDNDHKLSDDKEGHNRDQKAPSYRSFGGMGRTRSSGHSPGSRHSFGPRSLGRGVGNIHRVRGRDMHPSWQGHSRHGRFARSSRFGRSPNFGRSSRSRGGRPDSHSMSRNRFPSVHDRTQNRPAFGRSHKSDLGRGPATSHHKGDRSQSNRDHSPRSERHSSEHRPGADRPQGPHDGEARPGGPRFEGHPEGRGPDGVHGPRDPRGEGRGPGDGPRPGEEGRDR